MALTKCKECKKEVSHKAKQCPHCGVSNPGVNKLHGLLGVIIIIALVAIFFGGGSDDDAADNAPAKAEVPKISDEECKKTLQCWGDRHSVSAGVYCRSHIERLAKFDYKWTDGFLEPKMSRFAWVDQKQGTVRYYGDKIQLQNGFGAWQNHIYACDYDPVGKKVLAVAAEPGRL